MVAPVRWATPGTELACAIQPCASHSATIQSTSTPPPWPPMAITAMASGLVVSSAMRAGSAFIGSREDGQAPRPPRLQPADDTRPHACDESLEPGRIVHDLGAIEGRAQHGRFRHFAAVAAADAGVVDRRHRIVLQWVGRALDR